MSIWKRSIAYWVFHGVLCEHYPSILINAARESRSVELESVTDKQVRNQIDYHNDNLKILNRNIAKPRLSQDQILSNKRKKD
jgi:hypothetical protein